MSSKTTNYNLHKIDLTDSPADITVLNQNWDTIDAEMKALDDAVENLDVAQMGALLGTLPTITDANTSIADSNPTGIKIERWSKTTLNTPYTQGLTTRSDGVVITAVIKGTFATQLSFPIGGRGLYIRHNMVGSIYAWTEYGDFKADGSVPMTGTVLNMSNGEGSIENNGIDASIRVRKVANDDSNSTSLVLDNSFSTSPHRKLYLRDTVDGVNTDYKLYGEHNPPTDVCLPIDGSVNMTGTLNIKNPSGYSGVRLGFEETNKGGHAEYNKNAKRLEIHVVHGDGVDKQLNLYGENDLSGFMQIVDKANNRWCAVFGEHNKPSGSYTGNGGATERRIPVGGIGWGVLLYSGQGMAIVTPFGAIIGGHSGVSVKVHPEVYYTSSTGELVIASTNNTLNLSGNVVTYYHL